MNKTIKLLFFFLTLLALSACSKGTGGYGEDDDDYYDDDEDDVENYLPPVKADGHSFQFYNNSSDLLFNIVASKYGPDVTLIPGYILKTDPTFLYKQMGEDTATCEINLYYYVSKNGKLFYKTFHVLVKMKFSTETKGTCQYFDKSTNQLIASGRFTMDNDNYKFSDKIGDNPLLPDGINDPVEPDEPDTPVEPDKPVVPDDAMKINVIRVYTNTVMVNFSYDQMVAKKFTSMGYCWSKYPHPTAFDNLGKITAINKDTQIATGTVQFDFKGTPGTTYYMRAFAVVNSEYIYFNEVSAETVGGAIKLNNYYSKEKNMIIAEYDISRDSNYELKFYAPLQTSGTINETLGFVKKGKGQFEVPNYYCFMYETRLIDTKTGIVYYSDTINKY